MVEAIGTAPADRAKRVLWVTDDPGRNAALIPQLAPALACRMHDLYADPAPAEPYATLICDVVDLDEGAMIRLRALRALSRIKGPLIVVQAHESRRTRLQAVELGSTHILPAPVDVQRIRAALGVAEAPPTPLAPHVAAQAARVSAFYTDVFVADRPITPTLIDNGTELVARAIGETGIRDWIGAMHRFDDATHQHCLLVAGVAAAFATHLDFGAHERHRLTKAALVHDVGKIHVPPAILNKPGRLDDAELAVMRLHPGQGHAMLAGEGFEAEMLSVVRSHHELLDGSGYPDGLKDAEIPDLVRLITVCDIYAALIERRSYKPPMPAAKAYAILTEMDGRLDPVLVRAFAPIAGGFTD